MFFATARSTNLGKLNLANNKPRTFTSLFSLAKAMIISLQIYAATAPLTIANATSDTQPLASDQQVTQSDIQNENWPSETSNSDSVQDNEQDDEWADEQWQEESPWQFSGFTELAYGGFTQNNEVIGTNQSLAEARARLELNYSHQNFDITASGDLLFDQVTDKTQWSTRELTISASPFSALDLKIGRQVLTWGTGDYLFLNDMFAKDWQSFFSGRDDEYLKAPSNSMRLTSYYSDVTFDFVWTASFTPDNYLTGERFSFYSPAAGGNVAPDEHFIVETTNSSQYSARVSTTMAGVEYALYGYHGYWTTPVGQGFSDISTIENSANSYYYFPKLTTWGASALTPLANGIFNAEFAYYDSREDKGGDNPFIANSQIKALIGYEQEVAKNLTASVQYYLEKTLDYQALKANYPFPETLVDEHRHLLTLRLRYSAMQQNLTLNFFSFYSPSDKDAYIKPSVNYRYSDSLSFAAGANIFFGNEAHTFFGQHQDNSNAWLRARMQF